MHNVLPPKLYNTNLVFGHLHNNPTSMYSWKIIEPHYWWFLYKLFIVMHYKRLPFAFFIFNSTKHI